MASSSVRIADQFGSVGAARDFDAAAGFALVAFGQDEIDVADLGGDLVEGEFSIEPAHQRQLGR